MRTLERGVPQRTCIGCSNRDGKYSLIRFVVQVEAGKIMMDPLQNTAGRGNYVCPDSKCLIRLNKSKKFKKITLAISQTEKKRFIQELDQLIQPDIIFSLTGLARRAGKIAIGAQVVEAVIKKRRAKLIILAADAAWNTKKQFGELTSNAQIRLIIYGKKSEWGKLFGRESAAVLAVLSEHFASAIENKLN